MMLSLFHVLLYLGRKKNPQIFILNIDPCPGLHYPDFLGCYSVSYYKDIFSIKEQQIKRNFVIT